MMRSTAERRMAILEYMCERRHETLENLMFEFDVSRSTIIRDLDELSRHYPLYTKSGKMYQSYFIKGTVRGVDFRVRIVPPDYGGYTVLDIVYAGEQEAELVLVPYEITDEKTGRVTKGNSYQ